MKSESANALSLSSSLSPSRAPYKSDRLVADSGWRPERRELEPRKYEPETHFLKATRPPMRSIVQNPLPRLDAFLGSGIKLVGLDELARES
jgi:hypothetical protein